MPLAFNPQIIVNKYGIEEELIDGMIICNNPAMYAYLMAKYLKRNSNIRMLSLGTGRD